MKLPLPVILAVAVLVSGGGGAAAVLFVAKGKAPENAKSAKHKDPKDHKGEDDEEEVEPKSVYSLDETVVNLADKDEMRYLKVSAALGLEKKAEAEALKEFTPIMRDSVIAVLTKKKFTELHTEAGVKKAKREIAEAINERIHEVNVVSVYFESFAMQ